MNQNKKPYNREKTLAILTGIVCALIFLCGTTLGAIHSINALGMFGLLSVACYLICDGAIIWASFIDYHEDGNAMEWAAWGVKYLLAAYLLFSGGCIAWLMMMESGRDKAQTSRTSAYQKTFDDCMAKNGKPVTCRKVAESLLKNETENDKAQITEKSDAAGIIKTYVDMPLFKYLPGLLGLFGMFVLTLVSKLAPQEGRTSELTSEASEVPSELTSEVPRNFRSKFRPQTANFDASSEVRKFYESAQERARYWNADKTDFVVLRYQTDGARVLGRDGAYKGFISKRKFQQTSELSYDVILKIMTKRKAGEQ